MNEPADFERNPTPADDARLDRVLSVLTWIAFIGWSWVAITFTFRAFFG